MRFLLVLAFVFAGNAQAGVVCDMYDNTLDYGAEMIATGLDCANIDAIRLDLEEKVGGTEWCSEGQEDDEGISFCARFASYLVSELREKTPTAWGCTLESAEEVLTEKFVAICEGRAAR